MNPLYTGIAVVLAIVVVSVFFFFPNYVPGMSAQSVQSPITQMQTNPTDQSAPANAQGQATSLSIQDVQVGTGAEAKPGDIVQVQYIGKLTDGTIFDQSSAHKDVMPGCPKAGMFCFTLGGGQVIPGWDQGLVGMKVGGERTLVIPPSLGYGARQMGPIPANSTLLFDVKLLGIAKSASSTPQTTH